MASARDIKRRIRSVANIAQITKAMEVVSMTKMRRSQGFAIAARPYALAALDMLRNILLRTPKGALPEILRERTKTTRALLVVVTADKGLVGGFNDSVLKRAEEWMVMKKTQNIPYSIVTVGKKAREYFEYNKMHPVESFSGFGDFTTFEETKPVAEFVLNHFHERLSDEVDIIYTHFKTTLSQETMTRRLLPAKKESLEEIIEEIIPEHGLYSDMRKNTADSKYDYDYIFEPSVEAVLEKLAQTILKIAFHHVLLESNASEHSARMVTMKNASDNAGELEDKLTLQMNKARQAGITAEISEIIAGAEALQ